MHTVLITGGTGLIGTSLTAYLLHNGFKVIILTRHPSKMKDKESVSYAAWDIKSGSIDTEAVKRADYIIHLAGAGIADKRWTKKYKKELIDSRVQSGLLLIETLNSIDHKVRAIVSSSGSGWYSDNPGDIQSIESEPAAEDFLGQICEKWESGVETGRSENVTVCKLRCGIVLSHNGGALSEFKKSLRFGIAAILGSGKQKISWIHIDDLCRLYHHAMRNGLTGSYNAVAPVSPSNKEFILTLANSCRPRIFIPVYIPVFILKLIFGERALVLLKSTNASSEKIQATGFQFLHNDLKTALNQPEAR